GRAQQARGTSARSTSGRPYAVVDGALVTQGDWSLAVVSDDSAASQDFGSGEVMCPAAPPVQVHARWAAQRRPCRSYGDRSTDYDRPRPSSASIQTPRRRLGCDRE